MYTLSTRSLAPTVDQIPLSPPSRVFPFFLTRGEKNDCITPRVRVVGSLPAHTHRLKVGVPLRLGFS